MLSYLVIAALFLALIGYQVASSYQAAKAAALTDATNLALALEAKLKSQFIEVQEEITLMASEVAPDAMRRTADADQRGRIRAWLDNRVRHLPSVSVLRLFDANGESLYSSRNNEPRFNIADRNYFQQLKADPALPVVFGEVVDGRLSGRAVMFAAKAMRDANGAFLGITLAAIDLNAIREQFRALELGPEGAVSLRRLDTGTAVVRIPDPMATNNPSTEFPIRRSLLKDRRPGAIEAESPVDGIRRTYAYRALGDLPFYVFVGISHRDALDGWRKTASIALSAAVLFLATLAGLFFRLARAESRRERTMAELEAHRQSLHEAQQIANLGSYRFDLKADRWTSNDILDGIFGIDGGYPRDVAHWLQLVAPESRAEMQAYLASIVAQRSDFDREYRIVRPADGRLRWVHGKGKFQLDARGEPILLQGVIQDVTERVQAEAALRDGHATLHSILETSFDGFMRADAEGRLIDVNLRYCGQSGYTRDELLQMRVADLDAAESETEIRARFDRMKASGRDQFESRHRRKDGSIWHVEVSLTYRDAEGGQVLAFLRDIDERKRAEASLRASEERYRIAFRTSGDAININRLSDGCYLDVNQGFERLTGWRRDEAVGKTSVELGIWAEPADRLRMVEQLKRNGFCEDMEFRFRRKDGSEMVGLMSVHPITLDGVDCILSVTHDITARKATEAEIRRLAFYDSLTMLPNRQLLLDRLRQAMASSNRSGKHLALLFIDLDNFKTLNDSLGHNIGDLLLQQVGQRLQACVRQGDTVARLGGDEFVVLLEGLGEGALEAAAQAEIVGKKILAASSETYRLAHYEYRSTASIGITLCSDQEETLEDQLIHADLAMYQAKAAGRNELRFFDPQMQAVVANRAAMESDLREAISKGQLLLHYQPQAGRSGRITGAEALLRWRHPQRGVVPPLEFIPLAEDTGLILPFGKWVLESACAQLARWAERPELAQLCVAVNVSARQVHHPDFVGQVLAAIENSGIAPQRLKLELTESLFVQDVEDVIVKMNILKAKGVGFSLDDFGTGYSSLSYLKRLPLDELKIDRAFVRDILIDPDDAVIAKMIIALAGSLGLDVVAEGVETAEQKEFLAGHGCHNYQGYLFSRPLPLDEFERFAAGAKLEEPL